MKISNIFLGLLLIGSCTYLQACPPPITLDGVPFISIFGSIPGLVTALIANSLNAIGGSLELIQVVADMIYQTKLALISVINNAKATIQQKINIIVAAVNAASEFSKANYVDITLCVAPVTTALGVLDLNVLDSCANLNLVDDLISQCGRIPLLKGTILECLSEADVPNSLLKASIDAVNLIGDVSLQVESLCNSILQVAVACVNGQVKKLNNVLDELTADFNSCVAENV